MVSENIKRLQEISGHLLDPDIAVKIFEALPDALFVVSNAGTILFVNSQAEAMFGYTRDELFDRTIDLLVPEGKRGDHAAYRALYATDPRPRPMGIGLTLAGVRKDGTDFPVEIDLSPLGAGLTLAVVRKRHEP